MAVSKTDGTYWLDQENGLVHIYASKFSTYAIGYIQCYNINGRVSYGYFTGTVTATLMDMEKTRTFSTKNISPLSGGGMTKLFLHIRKVSIVWS